MPEQASRLAAQHVEQSVEYEDHQEGRSSEGASVEWPPLADERIDRHPEGRTVVGVGLQRTDPGQGDHRIVVRHAGPGEGTAVAAAGPGEGIAVAAADQAEAGLRGKTGELPENEI